MGKHGGTMKRIIILFLILSALAACGGNDNQQITETVNLPDVTQLFAETGDSYVKLIWITPNDSNVRMIMVRRKTGESVAGPEDGTEIYFGAITNSVYDNTVSNGVTYYYKVFTSDGKNFSSGVEIVATPRIPPDVTPPGDVYDVEVTAGENYVAISWKNPPDSDLAGIIITKRENSCPQSYEDGEIVFNGLGTFFEDREVENFHRYCYAIFTYDSNGNYSPGVLVEAEPEDVTPPPDVTAYYVSPATNRVVITWVDPDSEDFYQVEIFRDGSLFFSSGGTTEIYIDNTVGPGETHTYNLKSCDVYNNCTTGYTSTVTIPINPDTTPPSPVKWFSSAPYPPGNGMILSWENPEDPDFAMVEIYVSQTTCTGRSGTLIYQGAATTYTDLSCGGECINGERYCYSIYSLDGSFNYSSPVTTVGIPRDTVPPPPVTDVTANSDKNGYVTLLWKNPDTPDFEGVEIFVINGVCNKQIYDPSEIVNLQPEGYPRVVSDGAIIYTDFDPPQPADREHLCYAISSFDRAGNLSPAPATTVVVVDTVPPSSLSNVIATPQPDGTIFFRWTYPDTPDIAGVKILRRMAESPDDDYFLPCDDSDTLASIQYPGNSFLDITLSGASGAYYNYTFCVYDEWQNYSVPYDITVRSYDSQPPAPVSNLRTVVSPEGDEVDLLWDLPTDPDLAGVRILRKEYGYPASPTDPSATLLFDGMGTQFTDLTVTAGTTYYYTIYAYDYNRNYSLPASITVTPQDIAPPDPVSGINFADPLTDGIITISWKNPTNSDFVGVTIVRNSQNIPLSPSDGEIIYRGRGTETRVEQSRGTLFYYAFYTSDEVPNFSGGVIVPYYTSYVSHVVGGTFGEDVQTLDHQNQLYTLYYSSWLTRGVILESLSPVTWTLHLSQFTDSDFLSLASTSSYVWALLGSKSTTTLYKITPEGDIAGRITLKGNYDRGRLISGSDYLEVFLHPVDSQAIEKMAIGEDLTLLSVETLPGSGEFAATVTNGSPLYTYIDSSVHLVRFNPTIDDTIVASFSGYAPSITTTGNEWRIVLQRLNPYSLYLLSSTGYSGDITESGWYTRFLSFDSLVFYDPNTGDITYARVGSDSVYMSGITTQVPASLSARYFNSTTYVTFMARKDGSLRQSSWRDGWVTETIREGKIYTYLKVVTTSSDTFILTRDTGGVTGVLRVSDLQPVTTDTSIEDITTDGEALYVLSNVDGSLHVTIYSPPTYIETAQIDTGVSGESGKLCFGGDSLYLTVSDNGELYGGKITSTTRMVDIAPAISYEVACTSTSLFVAFHQSSSSGNMLYLYSVSGTDVTSLWSSILTSSIPSYSVSAGSRFIDIFYNNGGISWIRMDFNGIPISTGNYFSDLLPVLFDETPDGLFVSFRELTRGDLYMGRYISGNWYFAQVDTIGSPGLYPSVIERGDWVEIYYIVEGAVYRGMVRR